MEISKVNSLRDLSLIVVSKLQYRHLNLPKVISKDLNEYKFKKEGLPSELVELGSLIYRTECWTYEYIMKFYTEFYNYLKSESRYFKTKRKNVIKLKSILIKNRKCLKIKCIFKMIENKFSETGVL